MEEVKKASQSASPFLESTSWTYSTLHLNPIL